MPQSNTLEAPAFAAPDDFPAALQDFGAAPMVAFHHDADGLSAGAILIQALRRAGREPVARIVGKGDNAYSPAFMEEVAARGRDGLVLADLGVSDRVALPDVPAVIIDHHVPTGIPAKATVISGFGQDPVPTSSLLAYRCARALGDADDLLWLAATGIIGDMAEGYGFAEMTKARAAESITALRKAAALVNAPRRSASGNASAAFRLLMKARSAGEVLSGEHAETAELAAARDEVNAALQEARKAAPKFAGRTALIRIHSPCQVHPLIAQQWRGRLTKFIVIAANTGYKPGWVHFSARTALDVDLIEFFASVRPEGADENYGNGHRAASGGALTNEAWDAFVRSLGFGSDARVTAGPVDA